MPANTPIDSGITSQTLAFYNRLWTLWQNSNHVSAAWLSVNQLVVGQATVGQPEWNLFKLTTGQAPGMLCLSGQVAYSENGSPKNVFGAVNCTVANAWNGVLPLAQAVTSHGGAVEVLMGTACPALYTAGTTYSGSATTPGAFTGTQTLSVAASTAFPTPTTPTISSITSQGTATAGAVLVLSSVTGLSVGQLLLDTTTPSAIPNNTTMVAINTGTNTVTLTPGVTTVSTGDALSNVLGAIVASDGVHPFTYTGKGTGTLLNVRILSEAASNANGNVTQSSSASIANGAPVYPSSLQSGLSGVVPGSGYVHASSYANAAWPLHWSSSAFTTLYASQPTGGGIIGAVTATPSVSSVTSQGTISAGAVFVVSAASGLGVGVGVADSTTSSAIPAGATIATIAGTTVTLTPGVTTIAASDSLACSGAWQDAQAANANGNLNTFLDGIANLANAIAPYPLILRPMPESNNGGGGTAQFWYDTNNIGWGAQLFRYMVGYLTGNNGYSGQPVTANPCHNILFATNTSAGGANTVGLDFPKTATVGFVADLCSVDLYGATWNASTPASSFTTVQGVTGYSNVPPLLMEAYGNTTAHWDPNTWMTGGTSPSTGDLAGKATLVTGNGYNTTRVFAASGSIQVMTSTGVRSASYSSFTHSGTSPNEQVTFTLSSTAGVPTGSIINTGFTGLGNQFAGGVVVGTASTTPSATCANFLVGIKSATVGGCHFCINPLDYGGTDVPSESMLFQPGFPAVMQDSETVNLPNPGNASIFMCGQGQGTEWYGQVPQLGS